MYDLSRVRILIIESSEHMASIFRTVLIMLSVPPHNVDIVYNVEDGYTSYTRKIHDIIITDWMSNRGEGIQFVKQIRMNEDSPNKYVPIIMTAGSSNLNRVLDSRDAGVTEYLVKPFAAKDLASRLGRMIEKPKPFVVTETYVGHDRRIRKMSFEGEDRRKAEPVIQFE